MLGWRITFIAILIIGTLTLTGLAILLPKLPSPGSHRLKDRLFAITKPTVLTTLSITFLAALSEHTAYSYISIILERTYFADIPVLAIALAFFGTGAVIGNFVAGYGTDHFGNRIVILLAIGAQSLALLSLSFFYSNPLCACLILSIWGIAGWMYLVPIQHRLLELSKTYGAFTVSLNSSVLYLAIGAGGALGGIFISAFRANQLGVLGFAIGVLALLNALYIFREKI